MCDEHWGGWFPHDSSKQQYTTGRVGQSLNGLQVGRPKVRGFQLNEAAVLGRIHTKRPKHFLNLPMPNEIASQ